MTMDRAILVVDAVVTATRAAVKAAKPGHDRQLSSKPAWSLPGWAEPVVRSIYLFFN